MSDRSDIIDAANDLAAQELAYRIAAARQPVHVTPVTECVECGDAVQPGSRYCCAECRDDGEKRQRMARIQGKP